MRFPLFYLLLICAILFALDFYIFQGIKTLSADLSASWRRVVYIAYWSVTGIIFLSVLLFVLRAYESLPGYVRQLAFAFFLATFLSKVLFLATLFLDDMIRAGKWLAEKLKPAQQLQPSAGKPIPRSDFLMKMGVSIATLPLAGASYGVVAGAQNFKLRRVNLLLKDLPESFEGMRIAQISDIHSGSFFGTATVNKGVRLLMDEKPDMVFFTGDLVNERADEVEPFIESFSKIKAPGGVYSTLGNHDYGDYHSWPSAAAKADNMQKMKNYHAEMGWDLLMNENRLIRQGDDHIAVVGVENWGKGERWPKYGDLAKAKKGSEKASVKLLLSHDPSHWDAEVLDHSDIDVTFSGHTHGFQFGIEIGKLRWSPAQYAYKQWGGLYTKADQMLYVNRGFGFLGFPGRVGMPPEITIFTLGKAEPAS